jgi:hypothetical protein
MPGRFPLAVIALTWMASHAACASPDAASVLADAPSERSVTVYRAPSRASGSLDVGNLQGFALIRETRLVRLPAGVSRVRFEGVADGIEPVSALLTGLKDGVVEKNLDGRLLSPAALIAAAGGGPVTVVRTNRKTGLTESLAGTLLTGPDAEGVVFRTEQGTEALRCSGLPETFTFNSAEGLSATPTLSVVVRTRRAVTQRVTLSYLARGFDWAADYSATLSKDGRTLDLGAWVTLANANAAAFPEAHTQVVAGRVNHETDEIEPIDLGGPVLARCWPRGSTSDSVGVLQAGRAFPLGFERAKHVFGGMAASPIAALQEAVVTAMKVTREQLGDLKLYRVPYRTSIASHESKQVRLLDRASIPVRHIYHAELTQEELHEHSLGPRWLPTSLLLRTRNTEANHLGLPLPSGHVAVFGLRRGAPLLLNEADVRDLTVNEEVEIDLGTSADVETRSSEERVTIEAGRTIPLVPGVVAARQSRVNAARRVEIGNAQAEAIDFELSLVLEEGTRVLRADHPLGTKDGHPVFRLVIPPHQIATVRFQTDRPSVRLAPG